MTFEINDKYRPIFAISSLLNPSFCIFTIAAEVTGENPTFSKSKYKINCLKVLFLANCFILDMTSQKMRSFFLLFVFSFLKRNIRTHSIRNQIPIPMVNYLTVISFLSFAITKMLNARIVPILCPTSFIARPYPRYSLSTKSRHQASLVTSRKIMQTETKKGMRNKPKMFSSSKSFSIYNE